jgi:hypothetical protein
MKPQGIGPLWKSTWVAAALLTLLAPAATFAQSAPGPVGPCPVYFNTLPPGATTSSTGSVLGVLNETRERIGINLDNPSPLNQGKFVDGFRMANATERGTLFNGCGTLAGFEGEIHVQATSRIPANFGGTVSDNPNLGIGPISGRFHIEGGDGRIGGRLNGVLDFVPTNASVRLCGGPCPFVMASGSWTTNDKAGSFAGFALVPVQPVPGVWVYVDPTGVLTGAPNAVVPLTPEDFNADGLPEAKFIINLFD